jgi:hypothetical protein
MTLKERFEPYSWPATVVLIVGTGLAALIGELGLHAHHSVASRAIPAGACSQTGTSIDVPVSGKSSPVVQLSAKVCDKLVFHNTSSHVAEVTFGTHSDLIAYPGLSSDPLAAGSSSSLLLTQVGNFPVHEHVGDYDVARLTVSAN